MVAEHPGDAQLVGRVGDGDGLVLVGQGEPEEVLDAVGGRTRDAQLPAVVPAGERGARDGDLGPQPDAGDFRADRGQPEHDAVGLDRGRGGGDGH
jgi:hypothetical protein